MAGYKELFRRASLGLVDGLLLALCAAALAYLSVPWLFRLSTAVGQAAEPNKGADIQAVSVLVFLGVFLFGISGVFLASFAAGCVVLALLPGRGRLVARIGMVVLLLPVFTGTARRGPRGYWDSLIYPSIRENEAKQKARNELARKLQASRVLSVEREAEGVKITNNSEQLVRVQVAFMVRSENEIVHRYPGESFTLPPSPSDQRMNLPAGETRVFLFSEAHRNTGSQRGCGFDDYAVWGWDEKSAPVFLSEKAYLF